MKVYDRKAKRPERRIDRVGERYGKLLVVERIDRTENIVPLWRCLCDCGRDHIATYYSFKKTQSCTACNSSPRGVRRKQTGFVPNVFLAQIKNSAQVKNLECDLTMEFLSDLFASQKACCALTGIPISFEKPVSASLDRKDSTKGYLKDNVQWLHREVNLAKRDFDNGEFIQMCLHVARKNASVALRESFDISKGRSGRFWKSEIKERKRPGKKAVGFPESPAPKPK